MGDDIFENVMIAMQAAEEVGGPEGAEYVSLMERIAHEAQRRANRVRQGADLRHLPARTVRLRITDSLGNERWLAYGNGRWYLVSKNGTPLSFAYLGISREAEFGFRISDAKTAADLIAIVREYTDYLVEVAS